MTKHCDVTVVGGGPVGTVTALGLANAGLTVRLLEKRAVLGSQERATTFHPPTLEMLAPLGLAEPLLAEGIVCDEYQYRDAELGRVAVLSYDVLEGLTPYPFRLQVEQSVLTRLAREKLATHPNIELHLGVEVDDVSQDAGGVRVSVDGEVFTSAWVVGADGSRSLVRDRSDVEFTGRTYPEHYLVVSTSLPLHEIFGDLSPVNYVAGSPIWHVLLRNPAGWRMLFPLTPGVEMSDQERRDEAVRHMRTLYQPAVLEDIQHVTVYEVHRKVASSFRSGRALLVGDAAHVNNPLGGMGMNSGLHDGLLLVDPLVRTIREDAPLDLLDDWGARRREVALNFVGKQTDDNWSRVRESSPEQRAEVRRTWRELETDPGARRAYLRRASMLDSFEVVG
ncbi:MAG: NAD(P)/FAD-dependent oxidoreductase [Aeromicrobium sp.]